MSKIFLVALGFLCILLGVYNILFNYGTPEESGFIGILAGFFFAMPFIVEE